MKNMDLFTSLNTSVTALRAQRFRMNVIADNLANVHTTRTEKGEPYRRKEVLFATNESIPLFQDNVNAALRKYAGLTNTFSNAARGVRVTDIVEDQRPFRELYNPGHPDADEKGIVRLPNIDPIVEMVNMMSASRSYESNITAVNITKRMAEKALDIGS